MNEAMRGRARLGAKCLGLTVIALSFALAAGILFLPPPSHMPIVLTGIMVLAACGGALLAHGLSRWAATFACLGGGAIVMAAALTVRASASDSSGLPLTLQPDDADCAIHLSGDHTPDLYRRLRAMLDRHPRTRAVSLRSAGGSALAIERVAQLLRERGVEIAAMHGQCDSACAFLWVSAPRRFIVGTDRRLSPGFHAPHVRAPGLGLVRASLQDRQQRRHLARAGVPDHFVGWAYAPLDGAWRPDLEQLGRLGVAAQFIEAAKPEEVSFCGESPREIPASPRRRV
jgi:hypothetical protein